MRVSYTGSTTSNSDSSLSISISQPLCLPLLLWTVTCLFMFMRHIHAVYRGVESVSRGVQVLTWSRSQSLPPRVSDSEHVVLVDCTLSLVCPPWLTNRQTVFDLLYTITSANWAKNQHYESAKKTDFHVAANSCFFHAVWQTWSLFIDSISADMKRHSLYNVLLAMWL